jgi:hypothetical protein
LVTIAAGDPEPARHGSTATADNGRYWSLERRAGFYPFLLDPSPFLATLPTGAIMCAPKITVQRTRAGIGGGGAERADDRAG